MKLKEITKTSWIVISDESENIALLSKSPNNKYVLMGHEAKTSFDSEDEVKDFFSEDIFTKVLKDDTEPVETNKYHYVNGYEAACKNPYLPKDAEHLDSALPLYSKTKNSDTYYCAGYYCVRFPRGWVSTFCPRHSTLKKYDYIGPLKDQTESRTKLSEVKRNEQQKKRRSNTKA